MGFLSVLYYITMIAIGYFAIMAGNAVVKLVSKQKWSNIWYETLTDWVVILGVMGGAALLLGGFAASAFA